MSAALSARAPASSERAIAAPCFLASTLRDDLFCSCMEAAVKKSTFFFLAYCDGGVTFSEKSTNE
jgi:hypothetical protein